MKFTCVIAALALVSGVIAADRQDAMRNLARSLIAEYEDFLQEREDNYQEMLERANGCVARNPKDYKGMQCNVLTCQSYCVPGDKKCKWSANRPDSCSKCRCQKE
ncbi:hypothetical protein BKA70DRAFT_1233990 [Coprinopsis sp. MPI-PUGE-AT-0042]|nr:hypothetical protein BKA70DRAFT_1233990 [Coprinopsis sp. MPI-PUGE-AT-0042]